MKADKWIPIDKCPQEEWFAPGSVDLWLEITASALSMGWSDSFRVVECWRDNDGNWVHNYNGVTTKLDPSYITHYRIPSEPKKSRK